MNEQKTLKDYCKEAKKRLKCGFWQNYKKGLEEEIVRAQNEGISVSKVKEYYSQKVAIEIKSKKDDEEAFYLTVKSMLDKEGEVANAIGRLTDKTVYDNLSYEEKQRYTLELSEKYLKALKRYKAEKAITVPN